MVFFNVISYILVLVGALNWGLYGVWNFNLVGWIFMGERSAGAIIVYVLVALAAIWLIISPMLSHGRLLLCGSTKKQEQTEQAKDTRF